MYLHVYANLVSQSPSPSPHNFKPSSVHPYSYHKLKDQVFPKLDKRSSLVRSKGAGALKDSTECINVEVTTKCTNEVSLSLKKLEDYAISVFTSACNDSGISGKENIVKLHYSELSINTAYVHFELALLHAAGRFSDDEKDPQPDGVSCIVHLCEASRNGHKPATLALARVCAGDPSEVLTCANAYIIPNDKTAGVLYQLAAYQGHGSVLAAYCGAGIYQKLGGKFTILVGYFTIRFYFFFVINLCVNVSK